MINQLEVIIKEIIDNIDKEEIKKFINFEKYKECVLKYVKNPNNEFIEEEYKVMIFETIYINILLIMIEQILKYKFNINIKHNLILKKIDENNIFSKYSLEKTYIKKIKQLILNKRKINLEFFTDFYEKSINKEHKKILGQFYTPATIVNEMIKNIKINDNIKILDPACGAGIFLTEILQKYSKKSNETNFIKFINTNLYANDINPFAIIMTKINIIIKVINVCKDSNVISAFFEENIILKNIKLVDTLEINKSSEKYDLIIGNPPFFKITKKQMKLHYFNNEKMYGQTNIYELFINWAIKNIKKNGNIKYIIPQSFKSGLYFKNLRKEISKYHITSIININNTKNIFCEVEQAVLIINIKNTKPTGKNTHIKTFDAIENIFTNKYVIQNEKLFNKQNDSYEINIAKNEKEYDIIEKIKNNKNIKTLNELGYRFANGLFVWNQNKDIINNEKHNIPIIYSDYIQKEKFNFNMFIKNEEKKIFCKENEKSNKFKLSGQRLIIQRTSTFTQKNRLNAAIIGNDFLNKYKQYLLENHVNYLMLNNNKKTIIDKKKLYFFWAIINSDLINWIFKIKSGNTQISSTELNLLPICLYKEEIYKLAKIYSDNMDDKSREKLQKQIYISYGLNKEEIEIIKRG